MKNKKGKFMKKSLTKVVLATVLASMPVVADDLKLLETTKYDFFMGLEMGLSAAEFTDDSGDYENNGITTYGIKAGAINNNSRMYFSYQYMDAFENSTIREGSFQQVTMNVEGLSSAYTVFEGMEHSFFIGGHLGGINLTVDTPFGDSSEFGSVYGLQGGLLSEFAIGLAIELGYRYSFSSFTDKDTHLDKLETFYGGLNYRF